jgi:lysophospholipase L1-like esterase
MRLNFPPTTLLLATSLLLGAPTLGVAQAANPDPQRFAEAIARFEQWDTQNSVPENGVLFVGSSSIVRWPTAERFPGLPVINRGFGGSHVSDVNHFIETTVLRHDPRVVVFYAGNNDIAAGKTAQQVFDDYQWFVQAVLARRPATQVLFISIHPSILRRDQWDEMKRANAMIEAYSASHPSLHYVDISEPMLGADGEPMPHLFVADGLHLTPAGYDVWTPIVREAIDRVREQSAGARW